MDIANSLNLPANCRLCLGPGECRNICEMPYYIIIIQKITNVMVQNSDVLPKNICNGCCIKLDEISQFIEMCNESNATLNALYEPKVIKTDHVESGDVKDTKIEIDDGDNINQDTDDNDINEYNEHTKTEKMNLFYRSIQQNEDTNDKSILAKCRLCCWIGKDDKYLKQHEREHLNSSGRWKCIDCEKTYTKKYDLVRHRQIHTGKKIYECMECGECFTQSHAKKRHYLAKHSTDIEECKFECYICGQISKRKDNLEAHMLSIHIKKQTNSWYDKLNSTWNCSICGKTFSLYSYLEHHSLIHEGKKQKRTRTKSDRMKVSLSQSFSPTLCSICGKSFNKRKTYLGHMRSKHSNKSAPPGPKKDNYQCWQCGKIFSVLSNMKRHIRVHTGEKPYTCKFCGRTFAQHNSWHDHENIHTGTKPYKCDYCHKSFTQRPSLKKHLRSSIHRKIH
ncbi:unnamed protein product [Phaedon cochleariae]|uniref:Uncharacterized protein n=1 Tax=Phaedon cochleariae TaxID=80249 RepID=A0A9P0GU45_PHACE|nr:unnamed protein product [Phaedon cochleariae]